MATEFIPHAGEQLFGERVILARTEPGVKRRGQGIARHGLLDRSHDRPAAFARVLHAAGETLEVESRDSVRTYKVIKVG